MVLGLVRRAGRWRVLVFSSGVKGFQCHVGGGQALHTVLVVFVRSLQIIAMERPSWLSWCQSFKYFHLLFWTSRRWGIFSSHFLSSMVFGISQCRAWQCREKIATISQRYTSDPNHLAAPTFSLHWLSLSPYTLCRSSPENLPPTWILASWVGPWSVVGGMKDEGNWPLRILVPIATGQEGL